LSVEKYEVTGLVIEDAEEGWGRYPTFDVNEFEELDSTATIQSGK
jgi:hypothetical protein